LLLYLAIFESKARICSMLDSEEYLDLKRSCLRDD